MSVRRAEQADRVAQKLRNPNRWQSDPVPADVTYLLAALELLVEEYE